MLTLHLRPPLPIVALLAATALQLALVSPLTAQESGGERIAEAGTDGPLAGTDADRATAPRPRTYGPTLPVLQDGPEAAVGPPRWPRDLALFAGLLTYDRAMEDAVHELRRERHRGWEDAASAAKKIGDWHEALPVFAAGSALVGGISEGTTGLKKVAAMLGGVFAGSMGNETLNQLVGRRRPSEGQGAFAFDPLHGHASFPSGHAAFGFSMAGSVDAATDSPFLAAAAYTAAGATAASRLYHGKHWVSDVVVGAVIGTVVSRWSTRWAMERLGVAEEERPAGENGTSSQGPARLDGPGPTVRSSDLLDRIHPVATPAYIGVAIRF